MKYRKVPDSGSGYLNRMTAKVCFIPIYTMDEELTYVIGTCKAFSCCKLKQPTALLTQLNV